MVSTLLLQGIALVLLFATSAFFSMTETAMIGVDRWQVRHRAQQGDRRAQRVDAMLDDPERILSTVLVGNTIVNIAAAGLATVIADALFSSFATVIATVFVTFVVLILCELGPKTYAVQNSLGVAVRLGRPLQLVEIALKPLIAASGALANGLVRLLGVKPKGNAPYLTTDEIEIIVRMGVEEGHVEKFEQRVISDLFEFTETPVERVMTPADKVCMVPRTAMLHEALAIAAKQGRSRIIVVDGGFDRVLGFVHIKDLLHYKDEDLQRLPVTLLLRRVMMAPATTRADRLLVRMQREHRSLAIIQDGVGRNIGLCTADDLVEELVGDIHDEFDAARRGHDQAHSGTPQPQ